MTTQNTNVYKKASLMSSQVGGFEVVTMPIVNLASNTFTQANGALRSPNWPSNYPVSITSYTVFAGLTNISRTLSGTITTETFDHIKILDGSGLSGSSLIDVASTTSGSPINFSFTSSPGQTFTVVFRSDSLSTYSGFNLKVTGVRVNPSITEAGIIESPGGIPSARDSSGTFVLKQANIGAADVQIFTSNGTWTKPATASVVRIFIIGAGGGGGSGRRGAASTARGGGGGGSGGAVINYVTMPASVFASTESVVVAGGGAGGVSVSTNDTNGNAGSAAGITSFSSGSTLIQALGGNGGGGGTTAGGTAGASVFGDYGSSGAGGSGSASGSGISASAVGFLSAGGGGGGGGIGVANAYFGGGNGAVASASLSLFTSVSNGGIAVAGSSGNYVLNQTGMSGVAVPQGRTKGGGGGGGGASNATTPGSGGTGGKYGGGGGGGGASLNGVNSGAGGSGGSGLVVVVSW